MANNPVCSWKHLFPDISDLPVRDSFSSPSHPAKELNDSNHSKSRPMDDLQQKKTFAQALNNACDIRLNQLSRPCLKGDALVIKIPEEEYKAGL